MKPLRVYVTVLMILVLGLTACANSQDAEKGMENDAAALSETESIEEISADISGQSNDEVEESQPGKETVSQSDTEEEQMLKIQIGDHEFRS